MNAWLKLSNWILVNGDLPPFSEMRTHLAHVERTFQAEYRALVDGDVIAPGLRSDAMYWDRLNLSAADVELLRAPADGNRAERTSYEIVWANYVRWTFAKGFFYSFPTLKGGLFLRVLDNKSLPGREQRAEGDTLGRTLAVTWYERASEEEGGVVVRRVERTSAAVVASLQTIADILFHAGQPYPALAAGANARDVEIAMEEMYAFVPREVWASEHLVGEEEPHTWLLKDPESAEEKYLQETGAEHLTKMALARLLELRQGADRRRSWQRLSVAALIAALAPP